MGGIGSGRDIAERRVRSDVPEHEVEQHMLASAITNMHTHINIYGPHSHGRHMSRPTQELVCTP